MRRDYSGVLLAGLDERGYRGLDAAQLKEQWAAARRAAGAKVILAPGCSVPNDSSDAGLERLPNFWGREVGGPARGYMHEVSQKRRKSSQSPLCPNSSQSPFCPS